MFMACTTGTNTYLNIKELPVINDIVNGDFLIVETPNATSILDYQNFLITLDNTTFADVIYTNTSDIVALSSQVQTMALESDVVALSSTVLALSAQSQINNTFAVFSLSGYNNNGVVLHSSRNIRSATFYAPTSSVYFTFNQQFVDNTYGYQASTTATTMVGISSIADINQASIYMYVLTPSGAYTTTPRATLSIVGGTLA